MASVTRRLAICIAAVSGWLVAVPAHAGLALEFTSGNPVHFTGANAAVGWSFTTKQALSVTTLDAFDPGSGLQVRLYDGSGTTLASATILATDPTVGSPISFHSHAIAPVTLLANTTYYIAQDTTPSATFYIQVSGLTTDSSITYDGGVVGSEGQNPTKDSPNGINYYTPDYFGPNFNIGPAAISTPEPSTLVLAVSGALCFLVCSHRRCRASVF